VDVHEQNVRGLFGVLPALLEESGCPCQQVLKLCLQLGLVSKRLLELCLQLGLVRKRLLERCLQLGHFLGPMPPAISESCFQLCLFRQQLRQQPGESESKETDHNDSQEGPLSRHLPRKGAIRR
jgi:hypothetical protein